MIDEENQSDDASEELKKAMRWFEEYYNPENYSKEPVDISAVRSVYVGKIGMCCCGCSGTHYDAPGYKDREPCAGEVGNAKKVASVVKKINKALADGECAFTHREGFTCMHINKRKYIAYHDSVSYKSNLPKD